jgi:serralysin
MTGSNSGDGSAASPYRTISKAMWKLAAGDEVVVGAGTYNEMVRIAASGTAGNYITVRSEIPGAAKIVAPSDKPFGVHIQGDYVKLQGFDISGAQGAGVTANLTHHVIISDNIVHDNKTNGISASRSDFVTIDGNVTYNNASSGPYSGISIFHPENITGDTTTGGYRLIVRNNISYNNLTKTGSHSDGNGIIMDDFRSTKAPARDPYLFPSLVENNLVYQNGGRGIQVNWTDYATVRNNTAWHNNVDPKKIGSWHGELSNMNGSHNTWVNNIAVTDKAISSDNTAIDNTSNVGYVNGDNRWHNNLTFNGTTGDDSVRTTGGNEKLSLTDGNLLGVNPQFLNPPFDFRLGPDSPAIDGGTEQFGYPALDQNDQMRQEEVDMGAYESGKRDDDGGGGGDDNLPIYGTDGDDLLYGNAAKDLMYGSEGHDTLYGDGGNDTIYGERGDDHLYGGSGDDLLNASVGNNRVYGEAGNDTLFSLNGGDIMDGGTGNDLIRSGMGKDTLTGGKGADVFTFDAPTDAGKGVKADEIRDFSHAEGDRINLSGIDANGATTGNQAFTFIGATGFSGTAGELRYAGGLVAGDVDGDGLADLELVMVGAPSLVAADFLL